MRHASTDAICNMAIEAFEMLGNAIWYTYQMQENAWWPGPCPKPCWGSLQRSHRPLSCWGPRTQSPLSAFQPRLSPFPIIFRPLRGKILVLFLVPLISNRWRQWRTGPPGNREISRWTPASRSFSGPWPYTRIYFIDNQLTQSTQCAQSQSQSQCAQHSAHGSRRPPCESEWANDGDVSYSFTCRLPPTRIITISDENKKPYCRFYDHNWNFINQSRLYVKPLRHRVVESSLHFLTMCNC